MSSSPLRIRLLGPLEVTRAGSRLDLPRSRKARALLAYLAASGRSHSRTHLCDLLWQDVSDPLAGLRWGLSRIRSVVDEPGRRRIVTDPGRVGFECVDAWVDLLEVEAAVESGVAGASTDALREAGGWIQGEFLDGLDVPDCHEYQAWCLGMRERFRRLNVSIQATLADRLRDDPEEALAHALARLALDPYAEEAYIAAIDQLGRLGRVRRGLELYDRCRAMLSEHLDVSPSADLEAARRRLTSAPARRAESQPAAVATKEAASTLSSALAGLPQPANLPEVADTEPPLVGRTGELEILRSAVRGAGTGEAGEVVLITGEPGIGKTRLLRELVQEVRASGGWVLSGQVFESEEVRPYGPWADMLRVVPETALGGGIREALSGLLAESRSAAGGAVERGQLFDAVARLFRYLAEHRSPGLVAFDDVQWLDRASAALLHYVIRERGGSPLVFACAARADDMHGASNAARVFRSLEQAASLRRVVLHRLDAAATETLVSAVHPSVDPVRVFVTSEGNPLFALEIARSLDEGAETIPADLEEELGQRLERLDPATRDLLPWAAALGRAFDVPTLMAVVDRPHHEIVAAVDTLERRGILRVAGPDRFDFTHSLLRHAAYRRPSEPVRRAIHRRIARELDGPEPAQKRDPGAVAHHAELGGLPELAAGACLEAAERSVWLFAFEEAAELTERGLAQASALPARTRLPLEMDLLAVYSRLSMRPLRPADLEPRVRRVMEEARDLDLEAVVSRGHSVIMVLSYQRGAFEEAHRSSIRSVEAARGSDPRVATTALAHTAACLLLLDRDPDEARQLASEAEALAREHRLQIVELSLAMALLHHRAGRHDLAAAAFGDVVRLGRREEDRWWECPALTRTVMVELDRGNALDAAARAREAERLSERMRDEAEAAFARGLGAVASAAAHVEGSAADGMEAVDQSIRELRDLDGRWMIGHLQAYAAEEELRHGRAAAARERAEECLSAARALNRPSLLALARSLLARSFAHAGDHDEAGRQLAAPEIARPPQPLSHRARQAIEEAREAVRQAG